MHRTIGYLSKRFAQIRPGEGRKVLLTFLYFFLVITAYYVIKPVSRSLILGALGSRFVPYVDLACAIVMGPVVTLFARLVDRMPKPRLVSCSFGAVGTVLLAFWLLMHWRFRWVAAAFAVWVSIFSVLVVTLFWLVANDLYHPREAKRLFGFIGSGGILGGIVGSSIAAVGAQVIGTEHLLLLSAGLILVCWCVVQQLWRFAPAHTGPAAAPAADRPGTFLSNPQGFFRTLTQSRYLLLLVAMVGLSKVVATLVYYQFNPFIEHAFPAQDAKTTFNGLFFGGLNVAAFVIQFFFTSLIFRRWGLSWALWMLPLGLLAGNVTLLLIPSFWVAAMTELYDGSLNYSLHQTSKEVLYLPIDRSIRYKVKPFIDMVVFRFGKGFAAVLGIVLLDVLHLPARCLGFLAVPLIIAWLIVAAGLRRDYVATIRMMLQARAAARTPRTTLPPSEQPGGANGRDEPHLIDPFGSLTARRPPTTKLALVDQLMATPTASPSQTTELLAALAAYETHLSGPSELETGYPQLRALITDRSVPMPKRRQAIHLLTRAADQATVDFLFGMVMVEEDAVLRQEAVLGLVKVRLRGKGRLEFPIEPIRRQVGREVANYQRILYVASIYRQHYRGPLGTNDPVLALLRALTEESVEHIFRLLMLLYRPEDIHLIYEQMRVPDAHLRADALEFLDNLVDPTTRAMIFPILDEDRFLALLDEDLPIAREPAAAYRILQEAIWDHNCWLSVTTLCAVGRLRLTTMRSELEKASCHPAPVISTAAKAALQLAGYA